jgi:hypothetical protein
MHFCIREASDLFARYLTLWHFRPCCAVADSVKCVCDFSENTGILDRRGHLPFGAVGDSLNRTVEEFPRSRLGQPIDNKHLL